MKKLQLSNDELSALCMGLSLFLHAGVDAGSGLAILAGEESDPPRRELLDGMARSMDEGTPLSAALRGAGCFPDYLCALVRVGEETGRTEEALSALARYYEHRARLDQRLRSALLYPCLLLLIMLAVILVLLTQVLPIFEQVYASLGGQLTGVAGWLLSLGHILDGVLPLLGLLLFAAAVFLGAFAASTAFRSRILRLWRTKHGDRGVSRNLNTARFAQALSMGLSSGLMLEQALQLAASLLEDVPAARTRCSRCMELLEQGKPLARALGETELLPAGDCRLLELGMRSGCQDSVMDQIAQRLSEAGDAALERRIGQVEPALVVGASLLVGCILLSVMLPLMNIMTAIG